MTRIKAWKLAFALFAVCIATSTLLPAQTLTPLFSFSGSDGNYPEASLVQGTNGNLYGTTQAGGTNLSNCVNGGCGTVFSLTPAGALTTLYDFCARANCDDGTYPFASLLLTENGSFYGTTYGGGRVKLDCNNDGCGTMFRINPAGNLNTIYNFCSQKCADGAGPEAALVQGADGNLYGTVAYGGGSSDGGIVFTMDPTGALTTLYTFCSQPSCYDGQLPYAPLVQASDGSFYGTTFGGGLTSNQEPCHTDGCGTVFKITRSGTLTTLYRFCSQPSCTDGTNPSGGLLQASDGALYGMAGYGGAHGYGTVFRITRQGKFETLHSFTRSDGETPVAGLIQGTDGNLYGTTAYGGKNYDFKNHILGGTLFQISPAGKYTVVYNFCGETNCTDGEVPESGLFQSTNGIIYGTTFFGGSSSNCYSGCGTVFSLNVGAGPFVSFVRDAGRPGQTGGILGQGFTGTTDVSLNGTPASFTVVSDTYIKATIPQGATSGYVTVTTPTGVLTSNVPFTVLP